MRFTLPWMKYLETPLARAIHRFGGLCVVGLLAPWWLGLSSETSISVFAMIGTGISTDLLIGQFNRFSQAESTIGDVMAIGLQPAKWLFELIIGCILESHLQVPWETLGTIFLVDNINEILFYIFTVSTILLKWLWTRKGSFRANFLNFSFFKKAQSASPLI